MNLRKLALCAGLSVIWPRGTSAREADILDFSKPSITSGSQTIDEFHARSPDENVAMALRNQFEQSALRNRARTKITTSIVKPKGAIPDLEIGIRLKTFDNCAAANYAPAWWLSQDVAARRAAHYNTVSVVACEFGLPTNLLDAVIAQESGYKSWAVSGAGAMGIMQIMPGTARMLGLANPFDPIANMRAGARYLRQQLDRFGRVDLALAAYNAGPERRALSAGCIPAIPETRNYVRTITTNWARLAQLGVGGNDAASRGEAAMVAVHASGYRSVELVRYDGLNAANPM